jgi:hypothetical protein
VEKKKKANKNSVAGTRTRVSRVRAEYPNQLDYNGYILSLSFIPIVIEILLFYILFIALPQIFNGIH